MRSPLLVMLPFSLALHLAAFEAVSRIPRGQPEQIRRPVEMRIVQVAPKPPQPPPAAPLPPRPEPPRPKIEKRVIDLTRPQPAPAADEPAGPPAPPPPPVFGVTADSVADGPGNGFAVRVGNTAMKEMEREFTPPSEVRPLDDPNAMPRRIVPVFEVVEPPRFRDQALPDYPPSARAGGIEGSVMLKVLINEHGRPVQVRIVRDPGFGLGEAARAALLKSSFTPARTREGPVGVWINVPVRFVLD